jgi:hypothetical protein
VTDAEIQAAMEEAIGQALDLALQACPPQSAEVLRFFAFRHLPPHLRATSCLFADLATRVALSSSNAETVVALRKLLEAKDAAVRAVLP